MNLRKLLNISSRSNIKNIYIWKLYIKLISNIISIYISNIKNLV